jgi:hypothetical protein
MSIKQLRSHRIFNISLFDVIMAWLGMYFFFVLYQKIKPIDYPDIYDPGMKATMFFIPISIISHAMFDIPTELNYKLGISKKPIR